jgi:thiol-disulfide isomerase/thioredoxin
MHACRSAVRAVAALALALPPAAAALESGGRLASFSAERLGNPASTLTLADLQGKVVYVDFWASWCVPCRASMPALDALYRKHREVGFMVVGVNKDVGGADAMRFLRRVPVSFPLVTDASDVLARQFAVKAMPSGYLIDRRGVVRQVHRGFTEETATALAREVERLLEDRP